MTRQYQCVIFDWDGTLMNSEARIVSSIQTAAERVGFPVLPYDVSKQIIGLSLEKAILTLYPDADASGIEAMAKGYTDCFLDESCVPMLPFEGAEALLQFLHGEGVKVAIATGKSRKGLDQVLDEVGFEPYFHFTRTPVESESKPSPLMLQQILDEFDLAPEQAVMVGDTEFDMQMAQTIDMDRIALSHGVHELERLQGFDPVASFDDLMSMQAWLKGRLLPHA
ncbi:MAG: HAD family hydrolase [Hydrogenovibrio sp.]